MKSTKNQPLVSIICLCYNHEKYVLEALNSVLNQSYLNLELIIVDDASSDQSPILIQNFIQNNSFTKVPIQTLLLSKNEGNCRAFNLGFQKSKGDYIIDLAADDILHSNRIERQIQFFKTLNKNYGVIFSDAFLIDLYGKITHNFYPRNSQGNLKTIPPSGDIYQHIIRQSYICSPTMMIRRNVLEELNGYDETLSYEDYDFWVRSSRRYWYGFQDEILTSKRILRHSHSKSFYRKRQNPHLLSTFMVHQKALELNQNKAENQALAFSIRYHFRLAFYTQNYEIMSLFADLLQDLNQFHLIERIYKELGKHQISVAWGYDFYQQIRNYFKKYRKITFPISQLKRKTESIMTL